MSPSAALSKLMFFFIVYFYDLFVVFVLLETHLLVIIGPDYPTENTCHLSILSNRPNAHTDVSILDNFFCIGGYNTSL